jgi:hypothetical protein
VGVERERRRYIVRVYELGRLWKFGLSSVQCCGYGSGIRCLFTPLDPESKIWVRDDFFRIPIRHGFREIFLLCLQNPCSIYVYESRTYPRKR